MCFNRCIQHSDRCDDVEAERSRIRRTLPHSNHHLRFACICAFSCVRLSKIEDAPKIIFLERELDRDFSPGLISFGDLNYSDLASKFFQF